jgi:hypothetical protein
MWGLGRGSDWVGEAVEKIREGQGMAGLPKKSGCSKFLSWHKSCMYLLLLLLPTTKGQEGEGLLQCYFDQNCVRVLEGSMGWFGEVFK